MASQDIYEALEAILAGSPTDEVVEGLMAKVKKKWRGFKTGVKRKWHGAMQKGHDKQAISHRQWADELSRESAGKSFLKDAGMMALGVAHPRYNYNIKGHLEMSKRHEQKADYHYGKLKKLEKVAAKKAAK